MPGDDNRKRRHAARHVEFGAWIVDRFGRSLLEAGPVLDVAGGRGQLAWELQCVHGLRAVSLDPRKAKVPRKSRRKLLRKRLAALTPDSSPRDQLMARNPRRVEALLDAAFEASEQGRALCGNQNFTARSESSRRPPRQRRDACSMAWRCRFPTARPSQDGRAIAGNDLVKSCRVHPTHWLISTQLPATVKGRRTVQRLPVMAMP